MSFLDSSYSLSDNFFTAENMTFREGELHTCNYCDFRFYMLYANSDSICYMLFLVADSVLSELFCKVLWYEKKELKISRIDRSSRWLDAV